MNEDQIDKIAPPEGVSLEYFRRAIAATNTAYMANARQSLPSIEQIAKYMGKDSPKPRLVKLVLTPEFTSAMATRGIRWTPVGGITPEQAYCIEIITNASDRRPFGAKLKSAGVSYTKYRNWMHQPLFSGAIHSITNGALRDHVGDVITSLTNKALDGDMRAIEYYMQISGRFDPKREEAANLQKIIMGLLEILTFHIKDPSLLEAIGNSVEKLLGSNNVVLGPPGGGPSEGENPIIRGELTTKLPPIEIDGTTYNEMGSFTTPTDFDFNETPVEFNEVPTVRIEL